MIKRTVASSTSVPSHARTTVLHLLRPSQGGLEAGRGQPPGKEQRQVNPPQGIAVRRRSARSTSQAFEAVEPRHRREPVRRDHGRAADDDGQPRGEAGFAPCPPYQSGEQARRMGQLQGKSVAEAVELVGQLPGRLVAIGRVLCQALQADRLELDGNLMPKPARGFRLVLQHPCQGLHERVGSKRGAAGQDLVEDRTHPIHVGPWPHGLDPPGRLLGSHVRCRAFDDDRRGLGRPARLFHQAHQAEVGHARLPLRIEQDIRGLEIAVNHVLVVQVLDGPGDVGHPPRGGFRVGEAPVLEAAGQTPPDDQRHRQKRPAVLDPRIEDRHEPGVVELGHQPHLLEELGDVPFRRQPLGPQRLQGHGPLDGSALKRLVHDALTSTSQHVLELVAADPHFRGREMAFAGAARSATVLGSSLGASRLGERPEPQVDDVVSREESGKLAGQVGVSSEQAHRGREDSL